MMPEPAILLVDISNTRTKFMRLTAEGLLPELRMLDTAEISAQTLASSLLDWDYAAACVSSVVPEKSLVLSSFLSVPQHFISARDNFLVDFSGYPGAESLGADRVANAIAAAQYSAFPVIAIDMGTATTFDVVAMKNGVLTFLGGAIAPGLDCLRRFFHTSTAQLPPVEPADKPCAIGQNTAQAMQAGLLLGYRGLLREIISEIEKECGATPSLLATGGDASQMAALMPNRLQLRPQLTFEGIELVAKTVFSAVLA